MDDQNTQNVRVKTYQKSANPRTWERRIKQSTRLGHFDSQPKYLMKYL